MLIKNGVKMFTSVIGGTLLYLISTKIMTAIGCITLTDGRGFSQMGKMNGISTIFREIVSAYILTVEYYFSNIIVNQRWRSKRVYIGILALVVI